MPIDVAHRDKIGLHTKGDYEILYHRCLNNLIKVQGIASIVLCGSLAKGDIVEGWSDIDIIIFTAGYPDLEFMDQIKFAFAQATIGFTIGLGVDLVVDEEFFRTKRLSGRPLMMTFEVSSYGLISFGENFFKDISLSESQEKEIAFERKTLIMSEIHSWRRRYLFSNEESIVRQLFSSTKSLLRILQSEVGPSLERPINTETNLTKFKNKYLSHPALDAMRIAVDIRREWIDYTTNNHKAEKMLPVLNSAINSYPAFYEV